MPYPGTDAYERYLGHRARKGFERRENLALALGLGGALFQGLGAARRFAEDEAEAQKLLDAQQPNAVPDPRMWQAPSPLSTLWRTVSGPFTGYSYAAEEPMRPSTSLQLRQMQEASDQRMLEQARMRAQTRSDLMGMVEKARQGRARRMASQELTEAGRQFEQLASPLYEPETYGRATELQRQFATRFPGQTDAQKAMDTALGAWQSQHAVDADSIRQRLEQLARDEQTVIGLRNAGIDDAGKLLARGSLQPGELIQLAVGAKLAGEGGLGSDFTAAVEQYIDAIKLDPEKHAEYEDALKGLFQEASVQRASKQLEVLNRRTNPFAFRRLPDPLYFAAQNLRSSGSEEDFRKLTEAIAKVPGGSAYDRALTVLGQQVGDAQELATLLLLTDDREQMEVADRGIR